jgi:hypothetical protein
VRLLASFVFLVAIAGTAGAAGYAESANAFAQLATASGAALERPSPAPGAAGAPTRQIKGRLEENCPAEKNLSCISILYVHGTPYEMGYAHGVLLRDKVRKSLNDIDAGLWEFLPGAVKSSSLDTKTGKMDVFHQVLDTAWSKLAPNVKPEKLEEMRGLADGAGVSLDAVHRFHAVPDFGETSCSALVTEAAGTSDGHVYQLRILDYFSKLKIYEQPLMIVYRPLHGHKYIDIGWAAFVGAVSGINDTRVAVSEMGGLPGPGERLDGEPMPFVLDDVLHYASSSQEAAAITRAAKGTNRYVYMFGDPGGDAIGVLASSDGQRQWRANETDKLTVDGKDYPQLPNSVFAGHNHDRQYAWMNAHRGKIDLASIQELAKQIRMESNFHTVIYDLTAGEIWVANRQGDVPASDTPYTHFKLSTLWAKVSALP